MAIVIEEQKSKSGVIAAFAWIIILGALLAGAYYVFFKKPELIEVAVPANFENSQQIVNLGKTVSPDIFNSPQFPLQRRITPRTPQTFGRANPFLGL